MVPLLAACETPKGTVGSVHTRGRRLLLLWPRPDAIATAAATTAIATPQLHRFPRRADSLEVESACEGTDHHNNCNGGEARKSDREGHYP